MKKRFCSHGFSLVESTLVVVILGLVACMAIPCLLRHIRFCRLDSAAEVIRADIMRARYLAVARNCYFRVLFDTAGQRYLLLEDTNANGRIDPGETAHPPTPLPEQVRFDACDVLGPPSDPRKPPSDSVTFTHHTLVVGPDGHWASPGSIYLANDQGDHVALTVAIAGRVRIWLWDPETHRWE